MKSSKTKVLRKARRNKKKPCARRITKVKSKKRKSKGKGERRCSPREMRSPERFEFRGRA